MSEFFSDLMAGDRDAIIMAAAAYFVLMGVWSLTYCVLLRRWPTTTGKLTEEGLAKFGASSTLSDQDYQANVSYDYDVDGVAYTGQRLSPVYMLASHNVRSALRFQMRGITRLGDDKVRVHYKPSNPAKSFLIVPSNLTMLVTGALMFGAAALLFFAL